MIHHQEPIFYRSKSEVPEEYWQYFVDTEDLMTEDVKVVTHMGFRFYHFLLNTIATYLEQSKIHPDATMVFINPADFSDGNNGRMSIKNVAEFYIQRLEEDSIKTVTLPPANNRDGSILVRIKNLTVVKSLVNTETDKAVIDYVRSFSELISSWENNTERLKSSYCSRKYTNDTREVSLSDLKEFRENTTLTWPTSYPRVDNEEALEGFLKSYGVEISHPETFESHRDQIEYYSKCNVLIATTSAGLLNMIYMPPGSTIIELYTPLYGGRGYESYHDQYRLLSVLCGHHHVTLLNLNRSIDELKRAMRDNDWIFDIFNRKPEHS